MPTLEVELAVAEEVGVDTPREVNVVVVAEEELVVSVEVRHAFDVDLAVAVE